jgi:hypothetical protein
MSQKTNPISLRLQNSNKHFESCWYSDFFYNQVLGDEIQLGIYIKGLLYQAGQSRTVPSFQSQYKRYYTLLFLLDQRAERHKREFSLKLSRESVENVFLPRTKFLPNKNKACISVWDGSLLIKAQDLLRQKKLSQKERYKFLVEEGTKRERPGLTHKGIQNYVSNYAIKGSSLEVLFLSGLKQKKVVNKKRADLFNTIINPGRKHNSFACVANYKKGSNDFSIKSKGFLSFLILSFALIRVMPCIQESFLKAIPLLSFREQTSSRVDKQVDSVLYNTIKAKNAVFLKTRLIKKVTDNSICVQEQEIERENLFRRLIIDQHSQSSQNRLSYCFMKNLEKQFRCTTILSVLDDKSSKRCSTSTSINLLEKTNLKKKTTCVFQQEWKTRSLGLARHTELFLNIYSGNFGYHTVYPIRAISPFQSAAFLVESVAYLLQRKSSFRQIKDDIFRELDQYELIKGARLSCAGRLGGRSKKAQKAKTQSAQWGETSLTVFSSRLAFSSKGVNTTYGKVGVKVWLCYKQ